LIDLSILILAYSSLFSC